MLDYNRQREKTNSQKAKEYDAYLEVEKERAKQKMLAGANQKNSYPSVMSHQGQDERTVGKAKDIAAKKVGMAYQKAERASAVVQAAEKLTDGGAEEVAEHLVDILNNQSVNKAYNVARQEGWLVTDDTSTKVESPPTSTAWTEEVLLEDKRKLLVAPKKTPQKRSRDRASKRNHQAARLVCGASTIIPQAALWSHRSQADVREAVAPTY